MNSRHTVCIELDAVDHGGRLRQRIAVAIVGSVLASSCGFAAGPTGPGTVTGIAVLFLTQDAVPDTAMTALFTGAVAADSTGCLRLSSSSRETVIWPKGFTLVERTGDLWVRDADGRTVGRLGGQFQLGGGIVPTLHEGIRVAPEDRLRAKACPGPYWITGSVSQ